MFETVTNGYRVATLDIISLASILLTILVIISKNPVVSVLFLIGLFFSIACYLMLLGINFVGLSYLLVYVGAVSILFLFILMLINVRVSELSTDTTNSIPLVLLIAIFFNYPAQDILPINMYIHSTSYDMSENLSFNSLINYLYYNYFFTSNFINITSFVTSKVWDGSLAETTHITSIGNIMYSSYFVWLIITSIILLLAMVGSIVITINKANGNTNDFVSLPVKSNVINRPFLIFLKNFTVAKIVVALLIVLPFIAMLKVIIYGGLKTPIDFAVFYDLGLVSWLLSNGCLPFVSHYMDALGLNYSLGQILFGSNFQNKLVLGGYMENEILTKSPNTYMKKDNIYNSNTNLSKDTASTSTSTSAYRPLIFHTTSVPVLDINTNSPGLDRLPLEMKEWTLNLLKASVTDTKFLVNHIFANLDILDRERIEISRMENSAYPIIYGQAILTKKLACNGLEWTLHGDICRLIHIKNARLGLIKKDSFNIDNYIRETSKQVTEVDAPKYSNIGDMAKKLNSPKWESTKRQC